MRERQIVNPIEADRLRAGGTRIAPGIWADAAGGIHFSVPELLALFGWEDTPESRAEVESILTEILTREFPQSRVIITEVES